MFLIKLVTAIHSFVFRISRGRLLGQMRGMDFCVVKTKGARSGRTRYIPLMHVPYKKGVILVASMGGADFHPSWYWNIKAHPRLSVCLRGQNIDVQAEQVSDEKKEELWPILCSYYPPYDDYQKKTKRNIPVFDCQPIQQREVV